MSRIWTQLLSRASPLRLMRIPAFFACSEGQIWLSNSSILKVWGHILTGYESGIYPAKLACFAHYISSALDDVRTKACIFVILKKKKTKKLVFFFVLYKITVCAIACTDNLSSTTELLTQMHEPGSHYVLNSETTRIIDLRPWTIREEHHSPLASGLQKGMANTKSRGYLLGYIIFISQLCSVTLKWTMLQTPWCLKDLEPEGFGEGGQGTFCAIEVLRVMKQNFQGSLLELWNCCSHTDLSRNQWHLHFLFIADNLVS